MATAMFDSMAKFSSAIGIPVLGMVLVHFGWRANFAVTGIISVVYLALFFLYYRNPSQHSKLSETERGYIRGGRAPPEEPQPVPQGGPLKELNHPRKRV